MSVTQEAVMFDIDGTLLVDLHAEAWVQASAHFGYAMSCERGR